MSARREYNISETHGDNFQKTSVVKKIVMFLFLTLNSKHSVMLVAHGKHKQCHQLADKG